jgi:hypothetical protein
MATLSTLSQAQSRLTQTHHDQDTDLTLTQPPDSSVQGTGSARAGPGDIVGAHSALCAHVTGNLQSKHPTCCNLRPIGHTPIWPSAIPFSTFFHASRRKTKKRRDAPSTDGDDSSSSTASPAHDLYAHWKIQASHRARAPRRTLERSVPHATAQSPFFT